MHETKDAKRKPPSATDFDILPDSANVRLPVVMKLVGASRPTIWRWSKSGHLPKPKKIGPNVTGWNVGELRRSAALNAREAA